MKKRKLTTNKIRRRGRLMTAFPIIWKSNIIAMTAMDKEAEPAKSIDFLVWSVFKSEIFPNNKSHINPNWNIDEKDPTPVK